MHLLEQLFDLLYENMSGIAPTGLSYQEEKEQFLSEVGPALARGPRQIVVLYDGLEPVGYLQYYVSGGVFMVEELQLRRQWQATPAAASLWKFVSRVLPEDTRFLEAYADPRNTHSRRLMEKLGMKPVEDGACAGLLHYRGSLDRLNRRDCKT